MIDADNDDTGEYIEILNCGTGVLDLRGWFICDAQDTDAVLAFPDSLLLPGQYGIILDPDYAGEYEHLIPDSIPRFTIEDSRFGMYGITNTKSKPFALLDPDRKLQDLYITGTPVWAPEGYSMERFSPNSDLWQPSLEPGGTPGFRNSSAMRAHELILYSLEAEQESNKLRVSASIHNRGMERLSKISLDIHVTTKLLPPELAVSCSFDTLLALNSEDSCTISRVLSLPAKGYLQLRASASAGELTQDSLESSCFIPLDEDEIIITEFVCKTGARFHSEYVEYLSRSSLPIQCHNLLYADQNGAVRVDADYLLMPDSFLVLLQSNAFFDDFPDVKNALRPSAWRTLNDAGDVISLLNPCSTVICSLCYDKSWQIPGDCAMLLADTSLDYRDSQFWEVCYSGSPGKMNRTKRKGFLLCCPEEGAFFTSADTLAFSLINEGYFPLPAQDLVLQTPRAEHFYRIPKSKPGDTLYIYPDCHELFFSGTQDCRLYSADTSILNTYFSYYEPYTESPLFFNEILFNPMDSYGQAEFIELQCYCPSLDFRNWTLQVNNRSCILEGCFTSGFIVLGNKNKAPPSASAQRRMLLANFPSLPNSGALCALYDPAGNCMDSLDLREHKEIQNGKSLEKLYEGIASCDAGIWRASVAENGMTPGARNSICALPAWRDQLLLDPQIFTPETDERICFHIDSESGLDYCELFCFNMAGYCIFRCEEGVFSQSSLMLFWDGRLQDGSFPARGMYLVLVVLHDIRGGTRKLKNTLVIR